MLGSILKIGVPVAVQDGCIQVAFMFITVIANHRGLVDAAAVGLVEKMISFLFIVPSSMGATVSALTAQNAGAGKGDRACQVLKDAMTISVVYGCLMTVLMWLVAPAFIGFFAKDSAVVAAGTGYMRSYIFDAIFAGIHICFSGFFAAYGKSYIGFTHNVLRSFACRARGCCRTPIPTRCFPWASLRRAGRFCRQSSVLSRLPCSTDAGLLTSWQRSGATRNRPYRRHHQRRPHNLRDADHGAGCPVQIRTAQKTFG